MAKRKDQDNLSDILILANRKYREDTIEKQKEAVEYIRNKAGLAKREEFEKLLQLRFSHLKNDKTKQTIYWNTRKKFYNIISPLLKICLESDREENEYKLTEIKFKTWFDSLYRTGKEKFRIEKKE